MSRRFNMFTPERLSLLLLAVAIVAWCAIELSIRYNLAGRSDTAVDQHVVIPSDTSNTTNAESDSIVIIAPAAQTRQSHKPRKRSSDKAKAHKPSDTQSDHAPTTQPLDNDIEQF